MAKKVDLSEKKIVRSTPFGRRVRQAMLWREMDEVDLLRAVHAVVPGDQFSTFRDKSLTQQMLNHVRNGKAKRSYFTPFIAAALGVSPLWLGWGVGKPDMRHVRPLPYDEADDDIDTALRGRRAVGVLKSG